KGSSKQRLNGRVQLNIKQYQKTVSSIFWVQLALVACYTPFITVSILRHTVLSGSAVHALWLFTETLVYLNSSLNLFLLLLENHRSEKGSKGHSQGVLLLSPLFLWKNFRVLKE
ncbi:unnamed protein product, partial [Pocillopora meandrina]